MRGDNPRIERAGILVSTSAVFSLQLERMVREAGNPRRRAFRTAGELVTWLDEIATPDEKQRLKELFL